MAGAPSGTGSSSSQSTGCRMNGSGLRTAQAAVRADELLERRDLAHLRVVLAEQEQVRRVGHRVLALEAHDRVLAEEGRRVLALDPVLVEIADALRRRRPPRRAPRSGPSAARRRDAPASVPTRFGMELLELLDRQPVVVPGEPHEPEVAGADDGDRRLVGRRRDLLVVEVDDAVGRLARPARRGRRSARCPCSG